jgi:hypothetical protein
VDGDIARPSQKSVSLICARLGSALVEILAASSLVSIATRTSPKSAFQAGNGQPPIRHIGEKREGSLSGSWRGFSEPYRRMLAKHNDEGRQIGW